MRALGIVVLVCLPLLRAKAQSTDALLASIHRASPSEFRMLPARVLAVLEQRGCRVPQPYSERSPRNVLQGAFTGANRREWVVLCSVRDTSQILVLAAATGLVVDSLERSADVAWVQGVGQGKWGYSRRLSVLPPARIRKFARDAEGRTIPRPIDHDAINESFEGKGASAYYYAHGRWYRQITAD
jgi:hypothetical protein